MLLMSWAGEQARKDLILAMGRDLGAERSREVTKMLGCGVEHRNVRPLNVLWNPEIRNVVLIDFERSEILKQMEVLQGTSPNRKRKHLPVPGLMEVPSEKSPRIPLDRGASIGAIHMF
jgi:hypothetical protein